MSNQRLDLSLVTARLTTELAAITGIKIGTIYDPDYMRAFAQQWPAVWVAGQRWRPLGGGRGYAQRYRQTFAVDVGLRVLVQRYIEHADTAQERLSAVVDPALEAMIGWQPTDADEPFILGNFQDGPATESTISADLFFTTTKTLNKEIT